MKSSWLAALASALIFLLCAACTSGESTDPAAVNQTPSPSGAGLPTLSDLERNSTAVSDNFLLRQDGKSFALDIPSSRCSSNGTAADFTPDWTANSTSLTDAAYGIYRLTYDPLQTPVMLTLAWDGAVPEVGKCWVAFSDWQTGAWKWHPMQADGTVKPCEPGHYIGDAERNYAAVVVLGQAPFTLATIGYGTPIPPTDDGYTLYAPLNGTGTYLIDMAGDVVHSWTSSSNAGATAELLPNGHLLRKSRIANPIFQGGGGCGGRLEEFDWDGNTVWFYELSTMQQCTHHDFTRLPNGNILLIVWNQILDAEVVAAGRDPDTFTAMKFWADSIIEIKPTLPSGAEIVWEWNVMDHIVQDFNVDEGNFGDPSLHPELVDINFPTQEVGDWTHINCVAYNPELNQIMLTSPILNEIFVIDHSTTTAEAAGHTGGRYGRGGDLLYRWGNPQAYRKGDATDQQLFFCHHGHWIEDGLDGAGEVLVFNNQAGKVEGRQYSSVVQLVTPVNPDGSYSLDGLAYGPAAPAWTYRADPHEEFNSPNLSSVQRLPGGGTLICSGLLGHFYQLDPAGHIVWEYQNQFPFGPAAPVFRALRYSPNFPGLDQLQ